MSEKRLDAKNRWRNVVVAFRMSPEEAQELNMKVSLSGLSKQDYIIQCLLKHEIRVVGGMKVAKKVQVHLDTILEELQTLDEADRDVEELLVPLKHVLDILQSDEKGGNQYDYPVIVAGTEKSDIDAGKYGRMWIKYIKKEYPMRYKSLVRFGELEERADEVNDTAYELLDDIEAKWLKKHKPKNPNSYRTVTAKNTDQDDGRGNRYCGSGNAVSLVWGQKAPSKHENGGKKCPQNTKMGAKSAVKTVK